MRYLTSSNKNSLKIIENCSSLDLWLSNTYWHFVERQSLERVADMLLPLAESVQAYLDCTDLAYWHSDTAFDAGEHLKSDTEGLLPSNWECLLTRNTTAERMANVLY